MPRPWCPSSTRKATSASPSPTASYRPTAIIFSCRITMSATRSTWSTWVNRRTSRSERTGIGEKKR
ncbi:hypothetical protein L615_001800000100 [Nocardioides sp. J9]|nr:hypothetical protein L615_001800000100 [Nocardioides sp. J9]